MRDHQALYRAICAAPDEDTPRLAFADLVEEEGDCAHAAFIRSQVALARVPEYDPLHVATRQGDPDVLTGWGMAHTLPRPPAGCGWNTFEFRRGFPWKIRVLSLDAVVASGDAVFAAAPVQALDVEARNRPDVGLLADWPHLARVRRLEFPRGRLGIEGITRLGNSPHAAGLTELAFEHDGITEDGLRALATTDLFPRLATLELRSNTIPPALLVDALGAVREPGALVRLSLADNRIPQYDAGHLLALPVMTGLEHLDLSDNPLGVEGIQVLAESGVLRGLRVLRLERTYPGVPGIKALTQTSGLGGVRCLDLSANRLGPVAVEMLADARAARGLRVLNLSANPVKDAGAVALANSPALCGLLELDLGDTGLTDAGARAVAESPYLGNLLRLNLTAHEAGRPFGPAARRLLVERFGNRVSL
jgi:uncharacterized protein (TIGR02996 family)